ncbi:flagellar export chaperone FlgN [Bremerella sp. T1]|uniref:flagellar export chaperone FlgN n=1 Tax=Bremerella sp. TYQ1 TaxID=3119568 RepID=UPI001CCA184A|nr:flagellar export chaperone FlgN [Bremerella volcania]UBM35259.1 flagellar protein FlgN [Bremerella volcania]
MPLDLENETATFLQELSDVQADLLTVLQRKREQMVANDLEAMQQTMNSEQELLDRLDQLRDSRQSLLADARGKGLPADSLHSLAKALDSNAGELSKKAHTAKDAMRHIQNETLTNFVLAQQTVLHLSQLLQIIATGGKIKPTYEAENASNQGGTLVDQDA